MKGIFKEGTLFKEESGPWTFLGIRQVLGAISGELT